MNNFGQFLYELFVVDTDICSFTFQLSNKTQKENYIFESKCSDPNAFLKWLNGLLKIKIFIFDLHVTFWQTCFNDKTGPCAERTQTPLFAPHLTLVVNKGSRQERTYHYGYARSGFKANDIFYWSNDSRNIELENFMNNVLSKFLKIKFQFTSENETTGESGDTHTMGSAYFIDPNVAKDKWIEQSIDQKIDIIDYLFPDRVNINFINSYDFLKFITYGKPNASDSSGRYTSKNVNLLLEKIIDKIFKLPETPEFGEYTSSIYVYNLLSRVQGNYTFMKLSGNDLDSYFENLTNVDISTIRFVPGNKRTWAELSDKVKKIIIINYLKHGISLSIIKQIQSPKRKMIPIDTKIQSPVKRKLFSTFGSEKKYLISIIKA